MKYFKLSFSIIFTFNLLTVFILYGKIVNAEIYTCKQPDGACFGTYDTTKISPDMAKICISACGSIASGSIATCVLYNTNTGCVDQTRYSPNTTMPQWKNPLDNLQINIPGLVFSSLDTVKASCAKDANGNPTSCVFPWIGEYIAGIYKYAIGIVGILAAIVLMIGGVLWIVAGGNATTIGEAKAWIGASLTGLVIALTSYLILYQVNPALVGFKGLLIDITKQDIKQTEIIYTGGGGEMGTANIPSDPTKRDQYDNILKQAASTINAPGIDCTLLKAFMFAESSGNPNATSPMGAVGLMQIMPSTAQLMGVYNNLYDPVTNVNTAAQYQIKLTSTACNGSTSNNYCTTSDIKYIIAAYNGGPLANKESVTCPGKTYWECEANSGYAETRNYVNTVLSNKNKLIDNGGACN